LPSNTTEGERRGGCISCHRCGAPDSKIIKSDGKARNKFKVIVNKSTVPVGMGDVVTKILVEQG